MTRPHDIVKLMRQELALPSLRMRDWTGWHEPTTKVVERSSAFGHVVYREREIDSPIFDWEIDGKRFSGSPVLTLSKREWSNWVSSGERYEVDWRASFESLRKMVTESRAQR
jgi:hypothetical protein